MRKITFGQTFEQEDGYGICVEHFCGDMHYNYTVFHRDIAVGLLKCDQLHLEEHFSNNKIEQVVIPMLLASWSMLLLRLQTPHIFDNDDFMLSSKLQFDVLHSSPTPRCS